MFIPLQYKTLADCVCFGMNSAAPCMETTLPRTCDPSPSAISGDNFQGQHVLYSDDGTASGRFASVGTSAG